MHSSRMRTARCNDRLIVGYLPGGCPHGGCLPGVFAQVVSARGGVLTQACGNITFLQLCLQMVKIYSRSLHKKNQKYKKIFVGQIQKKFSELI